jgi:hypothetical protein
MGANMPSKGLGDDIKRITSATRLDKIAEQIAKLLDEDCGCDERQNGSMKKQKIGRCIKNKTRT